MGGTDNLREVIAVTPAVLRALEEEALRASPQECCGLLLIEGGDTARDGVQDGPRAGKADGPITAILSAANIAADPLRLFEIDPAVLFAAYRAERDGGPRVAGFYHSHPRTAPVPSATDQAMAARDGKLWAIIGWPEEKAGDASGSVMGANAPNKVQELIEISSNNDDPLKFSKSPVITFWRDDQAGFTPLSYSAA